MTGPEYRKVDVEYLRNMRESIRTMADIVDRAQRITACDHAGPDDYVIPAGLYERARQCIEEHRR